MRNPARPAIVADRLHVTDTVRVSGVLEQGAEVWGFLQLTGVSFGTLHVHSGGCLEVAGAVYGSVTVESGAVAHFRGAVHGDVRRREGGRVFACAGSSFDGFAPPPSADVAAGEAGRFLTLDTPVHELQADESWRLV